MTRVVPIRAHHCCDGTCHEGRECPQLVPARSQFAGQPHPQRSLNAHAPPRARSVVIAVVALALLACGLWIWPR